MAAGVQSVSRTLDILETVARMGGTASVTSIASATGIPLPTVHRLVQTLLVRGYLGQLADRQYCLGTRLVPLGVAANSRLGERALPVMARLVGSVGESVNIAMLVGNQAEYVQQTEGMHSMRLFTEIGRRVPLHSTSVGKAMLSLLPDVEIRQLVGRSGLRAQAPNTIRTLTRLLDDVQGVRERGWALDDEEMEPGVRCIAAPFRTSSLMAISLSGPVSRMNSSLIEDAAPKLLRARDALLSVYGLDDSV